MNQSSYEGTDRITMNKNDNLAPIQVKSTVDILIERITQAIIDGTFKPGERIPTEPELAATFGVGRNTVREAIKTLMAYGILEIKRPNGTFVCDTFKPQAMSPMLYGMILQRGDSYDDLIGLRKMFDIGSIIVLMDVDITDEQWTSMQERAEAIKDAVERKAPAADIAKADIEFHRLMAEITGNPLIVMECDMIIRLTYASRLKTIENVFESGNEQYLIDTHFAMVDALKTHDIKQIYEAVIDSYSYWKDAYN